MTDKRIEKIAKLLVDYSCKVKKGEEVLINAGILTKPLAFEVYKRVLLKGAYPKIKWGVDGQSFIYYKNASQQQLKYFPKIDLEEMKNADVIINIVAEEDKKEIAGIKPEKISLRSKTVKKIFQERLKKRWVIFVYPTVEYAKDAGMSLKEFRSFVFSSCLVNWNKEKKKWMKVKKIIDKGKKVRILSKDTDLTFSIKGKKAIVGDGTYNMPDGEVFTAPDEKSAEGYITFTYPRWIYGKKVSGIFLRFRKGKVVEMHARKNAEKLRTLLKTDKGSNMLGEFAFGLNPHIKKFTNELLFDEKMSNTIHLALGNAYAECGGKNKSSVHLDLIKNMKKGKIFIDSKLVYENGKFK